MFAIVNIAGTQEKVKEGDNLKVPLHALEAGKSVVFGEVLMLGNGDTITVGSPFISGASVEAKILSHGRGDKIRIQKAHKRKRYRRVAGHRQDFTEVEIVKIKA